MTSPPIRRTATLDSHPQLGDAYFDTRARLGSAIYGMSKLSEEIELDPVQNLLLQSLLSSLKDPFLFVVVGEVNAGKSTLLNALFGHEFCETAALPMTSEICLFKYGSYEKDVCITDTLTELYRPNAFLQDFNIVDTPGTNSIMENHQEITERFIPMADLVVFTFSVVNPWGATAWSLLGKIHKQWYKNIIFVLQQCDLREDEEIEAIIEHMKVTARQRLGSVFPIFAVSGKKAFLAKTTALDKERLWRESHFADLEHHIATVVDSPRIREQKLGNASRSARVILEQAREKLEAGARILQADEELVGGLSTEVSAQRDRTLERIRAVRRLIESEYVSATILGLRRFQSHLSRGFREPLGSPSDIQQALRIELVAVGRREAEAAAADIAQDLQDLWRRLAQDMQDHFNFRLRVGTESGEPDWTPQQDHLRDRLTAVLDRECARLQLPNLLGTKLAARRGLFALFGTLAAASAATAAAAIHFSWVAPAQHVSVGLAAACGVVLAVILGSVLAHRGARNMVRLLGDHFDEHRADLNTTVKAELDKEVTAFFDDFIHLFDPLHRLCNEHRLRYQPQITELKRLADSLDEVDVLIGLSPTRPK